MFTCPSCGSETHRLIGYENYVGCGACGVPKKRQSNCNLGQTTQNYTRRDGTRGRITVGKEWEMDQRRVSKDDNFTVINKATGTETEY